MTTNPTEVRAVLLGSCRDQRGLVAKLSQFIFECGGNITDSDQHTDHEAGIFATRLEWDLKNFSIPREQIKSAFRPLLDQLKWQGDIHFSDEQGQIAVFGSHQEHCILDLLGRHNKPDFKGVIRLIISNHRSLEHLAKKFDIPFYHVPVRPDASHEAEHHKLLKQHGVDLIVLAKYMQILSFRFLQKSPAAINIHHSFLPAFPGAQPYHQAFSRGVKIIGATAHFVTETLDEGPIIEQSVCRVSHRDTIAQMIRKGRDMETKALSDALYLYLEHRVLVYDNKTIVFQ